VHVERALRGTLTFHGCCWAYVPHLRRILQSLVLPGQLLHVPDPPRVYVPPPPTRPLSYAAAANTPLAHLAKAEHVYVRVVG
jgi:hypothetical protein